MNLCHSSLFPRSKPRNARYAILQQGAGHISVLLNILGKIEDPPSSSSAPARVLCHHRHGDIYRVEPSSCNLTHATHATRNYQQSVIHEVNAPDVQALSTCNMLNATRKWNPTMQAPAVSLPPFRGSTQSMSHQSLSQRNQTGYSDAMYI